MEPTYFVDSAFRFAISGATCWEMRGDTMVSILGTTNSSGRYEGVDLTTADFRVFAHGYRSDDFATALPGFPVTNPVFLVRLHPGFYSGYFPGKTQATWKQSNSDRFVTFRSNGFCEEWMDDGSGDPAATIKNWQYTAPEQEQVWTSCLLKPWTFPIINTPPSTLGPFGSFRFPAPGVMLGRNLSDGSTVQFDFVN